MPGFKKRLLVPTTTFKESFLKCTQNRHLCRIWLKSCIASVQLEGEDSHGACFSIRSIVVVGQLSTIPVSSWDLKSNKSQDTQGARLKLYSWRMFNNIKHSYFSQEYPFNIEYYAFSILCFHISQPYYFDIEFYTLTFDFFIFPICTLLLFSSQIHPQYPRYFRNMSKISVKFCNSGLNPVGSRLQLWIIGKQTKAGRSLETCGAFLKTVRRLSNTNTNQRCLCRISKNCAKAFKHKYNSVIYTLSHF